MQGVADARGRDVSGWTPKRFWQNAHALPCQGGFTVQLDGKPVRTPAKGNLVLPTLALAQEIAGEWQAQQDRVRPQTMPFTRSANSAIDKIMPQFAEVADLITAYGASDLLCYRATAPNELIQRQQDGWQPLLDWAGNTLDAPLNVTEGVIPVEQPTRSLAALDARVRALSVFQMVAFHDLVAISGSLVLGFAMTMGRVSPAEGWALSRIDEDWQAALWGVDDEAAELAQVRRSALAYAARFFYLCG